MFVCAQRTLFWLFWIGALPFLAKVSKGETRRFGIMAQIHWSIIAHCLFKFCLQGGSVSRAAHHMSCSLSKSTKTMLVRSIDHSKRLKITKAGMAAKDRSPKGRMQPQRIFQCIFHQCKMPIGKSAWFDKKTRWIPCYYTGWLAEIGIHIVESNLPRWLRWLV